LYPPTNIVNVSRNWVYDIDCNYKKILRVGAMILIWSLWLRRNDKVFYNNFSLSCMGTLRLLSQLYRTENHDLFSKVCTRMEDIERGLLLPYG
jgi:hypothetical protein